MRSYRPVVDSLFGVVGDAPDGEFTVPIGGTVVAPGGQGSCGGSAAAVDGAPAAPEAAGVVVVVARPGVVEAAVAAPVVGAPGVADPGAPGVPGVVVAFGVDGDCVVLVVPRPLVFVPVPVPEFLGCVVVPVPAPDGMHGGAAVGDGVVPGVVCVVPGVGAIVPDGVGAVVGGFCAAMPMTDIVAANANALERIVSLRCIA